MRKCFRHKRRIVIQIHDNLFSVGAFDVYQGYLKQFERSDEKELTSHNVEVEAKRCVILAIKVPTVIDFADILKLKAVKYLQGVL